MTESEEREYLIDLLFESARWKVDHDEVLNGLELEVRDRLRRLSGVNTVDQDGLCQSDLPDNLPAEDEALTSEDFKTIEAARLNEHLASVEKVNESRSKWERGKVRVFIAGKHVWKPLAQCHKEKLFPDNPKSKKFKWVWDEPQDKEVNKLSDELWEAHENGNDL